MADPDHDSIQEDLKFTVPGEYDAGYNARALNVEEYRTATASWRAGWRDADRDVRNGLIASNAMERSCSDCGLATYGTGRDARLCELKFDERWTEEWKRDWVRADIALAAARGRSEP